MTVWGDLLYTEQILVGTEEKCGKEEQKEAESGCENLEWCGNENTREDRWPEELIHSLERSEGACMAHGPTETLTVDFWPPEL